MPGLYNITGNTGSVAVSNTTGLYIGNGRVPVLNNAQQLLNLLSDSPTVDFYLDPTTGNSTVTATAIAPSYGNTNVAAFLPTYSGGIGSLTSSGFLSAATTLSAGTSVTTPLLQAPTGLPGSISSLAFDGVGNMNITTWTNATTHATVNIYSDLHVLGSSPSTGIPSKLIVDGNTSLVNVAITGITTTGAMSTSGNYTATGNITSTGGYFVGDGSKLTGVVTNSYGNANVAAFLPVYGGNIAANFVTASGSISTTKSIIAANTVTANAFVTTGTSGNITGVNYITANFFVGNGSQLTGITATGNYTNANVAAYLPTYTGAMTSMTGNVTTTANISGAYILGNGSQLTGLPATYANANVAAYLPTYTGAMTSMTGNVTTTANVSGAYILGNGSQLTGLPATYSNASVASYLPTYTGNLVSLTGNVITTANVRGNYFIGNGSTLTGIVGANVSGTVANATYATTAGSAGSATSATTAGTATYVTGNAQANITSVGTLSALTVSGNVSASYYTGNGSLLTNLTGANVTGTVANATSSGTATYVTNATQSNITSVGSSLTIGPITIGSNSITSTNNTITIDPSPGGSGGNVVIEGNLRVTGNLTAVNSTQVTVADKNIILANNQTTLLGIDSAGIWLGNGAGAPVASWTYNYAANALVSTIGIQSTNNMTAPAFIGSGQYLTAITGANVSGTVANATYSTQAGQSNSANTATSATTAGTATYVTGNAQANITSVGTLTSLTATGNVTTSANVSAAYVIGNGSALTNLTGANVTGTVANATYATTSGSTGTATSAGLATYVTANAQANITSVGTLTSLTSSGNITAANLISNGSVTATGTFYSGNIITGGTSGNITGANYINANYFVGNGSLLTGIATGTNYTNANVAAYLPTYTGAMTAMTGNVTTTANVQGAYIIGNGSALTSLSGAAVTGTVATATSATYVTGLTSANVTTALGYVPLNSNSYVAYGNTQVANYLPTYTGNLVSLAGNVTTTANVSGAYILGNGSALTSLTGSAVVGAVNAATYVLGLTSANVTTALGYVPADSNAASNYGNANVAAYLPTYTGNLVSLTGNVTTTANITTGNLITAANAGLVQTTKIQSSYTPNTLRSNISFDSSGNMNIGTVAAGGGAATVNAYSGWHMIGTGNQLTVDGSSVLAGVTASGTLTAANIVSNTQVTASGNITSTSGNVSGNYLLGNGAFITGLSTGSNYGDSNVAAYLPTYTGAIAAMTGNLATTANASVGNLSVTGLVSSKLSLSTIPYSSIPVNATGNVTSRFTVNQVGSSDIGTATFYRSSTSLEPFFSVGRNNSNDGAVLANVTTNMNLFTLNALGVIGANNKTFSSMTFASNTTGTLSNTSSPGRITFATTPDGSTTARNVMRLQADGTMWAFFNAQVSGNLVAGNIASNVAVTAATVTTTGNITTSGGYFIGNGSQLTGITTSSGGFNPFLLAGM